MRAIIIHQNDLTVFNAGHRLHVDLFLMNAFLNKIFFFFSLGFLKNWWTVTIYNVASSKERVTFDSGWKNITIFLDENSKTSHLEHQIRPTTPPVIQGYPRRAGKGTLPRQCRQKQHFTSHFLKRLFKSQKFVTQWSSSLLWHRLLLKQ